MCMATNPTPVAAATSPREADTSLIMRAPAATAASATAALRVSIDTATPSAASASTTGTTRRSSSSTGTGSARGRVDSPPTSIQSAPSSTDARPCAMAIAWSRNWPPSENESGVTLTTPMTRRLAGCTSPDLMPRPVAAEGAGEAARPRSVVRRRRGPTLRRRRFDDDVEGELGHRQEAGLPLGRAELLAPADVVADRRDAQRPGPVRGGDRVESGRLHLDGEHAVVDQRRGHLGVGVVEGVRRQDRADVGGEVSLLRQPPRLRGEGEVGGRCVGDALEAP